MPRQPVRVQIFNQSYSLVTDTDPREVHEVAHQVDELMTSIANHTGSGDTTRVAVLACLHLADKLRDAEKQLEAHSGRIANMLEEALGVTEATEPPESPPTARPAPPAANAGSGASR
jgi:cell division protein ZapA